MKFAMGFIIGWFLSVPVFIYFDDKKEVEIINSISCSNLHIKYITVV
jgi:hypothetical protein|tara:strand:+ start:1896 stop:2036 length:141 start_codon:yes stop_codon:yes gene_type:complete